MICDLFKDGGDYAGMVLDQVDARFADECRHMDGLTSIA